LLLPIHHIEDLRLTGRERAETFVTEGSQDDYQVPGILSIDGDIIESRGDMVFRRTCPDDDELAGLVFAKLPLQPVDP
jgi:hypothetical protein